MDKDLEPGGSTTDSMQDLTPPPPPRAPPSPHCGTGPLGVLQVWEMGCD